MNSWASCSSQLVNGCPLERLEIEMEIARNPLSTCSYIRFLKCSLGTWRTHQAIALLRPLLAPSNPSPWDTLTSSYCWCFTNACPVDSPPVGLQGQALTPAIPQEPAAGHNGSFLPKSKTWNPSNLWHLWIFWNVTWNKDCCFFFRHMTWKSICTAIQWNMQLCRKLHE